MSLNRKPPTDWDALWAEVMTWVFVVSFIMVFVIGFIMAAGNE